MASEVTELRWLLLQGPPVRLGTGPSVPLWRMMATAPPAVFGQGRLFPLRTAAVDPAPVPLRPWGRGPTDFLRPRLLAAQAMAGGPYPSGGQKLEALSLAAPPGSTPISAGNTGGSGPAAFATILHPNGTAAEFVTAMLEPVTADGGWVEQTAHVALPPMRLAAGSILLRLGTDSPVSKALAGAFAGTLDPVLELTPHGIVLAGAMRLPGTADPLPGRFLLAGRDAEAGTLSLKLLTDGTWAKAWRDAWDTTVPTVTATHLGVTAPVGGPPPAFEWPLVHDPARNVYVLLDGRVYAGAGDLAIRLEGTRTDAGGPDGVAVLGGARPCVVPLAGGAIGITLDAGATSAGAVSLGYRYDRAGEVLRLPPGLDLPAALDEVALAARLRAVQGVPGPLPPGPDGNFVAEDPAPPVLFAFTRLRDGWLQWPVPNLPEFDPDDDAGAGVDAAPVPDVLDGFVRFSRAAESRVSSASGPRGAPPLTPDWAVTMDAAMGFAVRIEAAPAAGGKGFDVRSCDIVFEAPGLRFDGVLWLSADRPDGTEALPRPSAGPGSFFDVPLRVDSGGTLPAGAVLRPVLRGTTLTLAGARTFGTELGLGWNAAAPAWAALLKRPGYAERWRAIAGFLGAELPPPRKPAAQTAPGLQAALDEAGRLPSSLAAATATADALARLMAKTEDPSGLLRGSLGSDLRLRRQAVLDEQATLAAALADARRTVDALTAATAPAAEAVPDPSPRALAWRRHPRLPLAATMPMTRSVTGTTRASESRELAPFTLGEQNGRFVTLGWDPALGAATVGAAHTHEPLAAWPKPVDPEWGIAFAALGVPGMELMPSGVPEPWASPMVAYRFDLPALDEAFALATTTPQPQSAGSAAPDPAATAAEPLTLLRLWRQRRRERQNSLVRQSYAFPFITLAGDPPVRVANVLDGRGWTVRATLDDAATVPPGLEFGKLKLGPLTLSGNAALGGFTGSAALASGGGLTLVPADTAGGTIPVAGWSVATFADPSDGSLSVDYGGLAIGEASEANGLHQRRIRLPSGRLAVLVTMPLAIDLAGGTLRFWCCNLPLASTPVSGGGQNWSFPPENAQDGDDDAWSAGSLAKTGFEWRFWNPASPRAEPLPFGGFMLAPLELQEVKFGGDANGPGGTPLSVTVLAALSLSGRPTPNDGQVLSLTFIDVGGGLVLSGAAVPQAPFRIHDTIDIDIAGMGCSGGPLVLEAVPAVHGGVFSLQYAAATVRCFGRAFRLTLGTLGAMAGEVAQPPAPDAGGWLRVSSARLSLADARLTLRAELVVALPDTKARVLRYDIGTSSLEVFNATLLLETSKDTGHDAVVATRPSSPASGSLVDGLGFDGPCTALLAAALPAGQADPPSNLVPLACALVQFTVAPNPTLRRFGMTVSVEGNGSDWTCDVTLRGAIGWRSAIEWPAARVAPESGSQPNIRTLVIDATKRALHYVTLRLDGQRLAIESLTRTDKGWRLARTVAFQAVSDHELLAGDTRVGWRSLDTVRLVRSLAEPPPVSPAGFAPFSPSANPPVGGPWDVIARGIGPAGKVLDGIDGDRFRAAAKAAGIDGLALVGWFDGLLRPGNGPDDPSLFVRLPWLAMLATPGKPLRLPQDAEASFVLAWPDIGAPADIRVRRVDTVALTRTDPAAIAEAVAGAGQEVAVPVEQIFRPNRQAAQPDLAECFWPGSLPGVTALVAAGDARSPSFSLVALAGRGGTALVAMAPPAGKPESEAVPPLPDVVISGSTAIAYDLWSLGRRNSGGGRSRAALTACAHRAEPSFIVIRAGSGPDLAYIPVPLPARLNPPPALLAKAGGLSRFASPQLGWPADPVGASGEDWLAPVQTGGTAPVRDGPTGLLGLARSVALPAAVGVAGTLDPDALVWVGDSAGTPWIPFPVRDLRSPPIPWLTPAPPRVRLPDAVAAAMAAVSPETELQTFVPSDEAQLTAGARAGVLTVGRTALFRSIGHPASDGDGFGVRAQAVATPPVELRTPRPLVFEPNIGDAERDRRLQAAPPAWNRNCMFVAGSADSVSACDRNPDWTIFVTVGPGFAAGVSALWDGSVSVVFRPVVRSGPVAPRDDPSAFVWQRLFGDGASGGLWIGGICFPFRSVRIAAAASVWTLSPGLRESWEGTVPVVLDGRAATDARGTGPALPAIARACLASGAVQAEWRLTTPATFSAAATVPGIEEPRPLAGPAGTLPAGVPRPPTTLRLALALLRPGQFGLPLQTLSVLFSDPAYDRTLSGPPAKTTALTPAGAGGGSWRAVLYTDSTGYRPGDTIALMAELVEDAGTGTVPPPAVDLALSIQVLSAGQPARSLAWQGKQSLPLSAGTPTLLDTGLLTEPGSGGPAALACGEVLRLHVDDAGPRKARFRDLEVAFVAIRPLEPAGAVYAALLRTASAITVPLHMQSPEPARVDFLDLAADFRTGWLNRRAVFSWMTAWPADDCRPLQAFVSKMDRSGQTLLPTEAGLDGGSAFVPLW